MKSELCLPCVLCQSYTVQNEPGYGYALCDVYSIWLFMYRYIMPLSCMRECRVFIISGGGGG